MPFLIPSPERKLRLRSIQATLSAYEIGQDVNSLAEAVRLMLVEPTFQTEMAAGPRRVVQTEKQLTDIAWAFFYHLLYRGDLVAAALMLWDQETFSPEPHCVQLVWEALMANRMIGIIGGGAMGKTYSASAYFLLQWVADPEWTRFQIASASEDHLRKNLYADVVRLHQGASLPLPGEPDSESISLNKKVGQGIFCLVLPGGPLSKGKIKGSHTKPRPRHPIYGRRSRVFLLLDEAQEIPQNIFSEIPNRFSSLTPGDITHLQVVCCANPKDVFSEFGRVCRPKCGFDNLPLDQETWESEEGWAIVSLNAMRHENVVQRRVVYPGFVTWDGVQQWLKRCHGNDQDPQFWTYVIGRFPPQGTTAAVVQQAHLNRSEKEWIFDSPTIGKGSFDPAFTGDQPVFSSGRVGRAVAWRTYDGIEHKLETPRWVLQVDAVAPISRGDTQELSDENMARLKVLSVAPEGYAIDKTGSGIGVHDVISRQWAQKVGPFAATGDRAPICGINYAQMPTEHKIAEEDSMTPRDQFDRIASELWFAGAKLFEYDCVGLGRGVDLRVFTELAARKGGMQVGLGRKLTIETKDAYKSRTGMSSPDFADSVLLLLHVARITTPGLIPKAKDTAGSTPERGLPAWSGFNQAFGAADLQGMPSPQLCDLTKD